jgi:hypothetical protein
MKNRNRVTAEMVTRANDRLIGRGSLDPRVERVYSAFLGKKLDISVRCDSQTLSSAWKKARERTTE